MIQGTAMARELVGEWQGVATCLGPLTAAAPLPPNLGLCSNSIAPIADPLVMIMSSMTNKSCCNSLLWLMHLTLPHPCWEQDSAP